jgi:hypothetical protein
MSADGAGVGVGANVGALLGEIVGWDVGARVPSMRVTRKPGFLEGRKGGEEAVAFRRTLTFAFVFVFVLSLRVTEPVETVALTSAGSKRKRRLDDTHIKITREKNHLGETLTSGGVNLMFRVAFIITRSWEEQL